VVWCGCGVCGRMRRVEVQCGVVWVWSMWEGEESRGAVWCGVGVEYVGG
jgi:hypothetical protein